MNLPAFSDLETCKSWVNLQLYAYNVCWFWCAFGNMCAYICLLQLRKGHKLKCGPSEALMSFLDSSLCSGSTQADGIFLAKRHAQMDTLQGSD